MPNKVYKYNTPCDSYTITTSRSNPFSSYHDLSPFELKDVLIKIGHASSKKNGKTFMDAGRGNPNFLSLRPREAFAVLTLISTQMCDPVAHSLAIMPSPPAKGIAKKFFSTLAKMKSLPSAGFLENAMTAALKITKLEPDALVHQMVIATLGSFYPVPPSILPFHDPILQQFLAKAIFRNPKIPGNVQLFPTEGAAAGILYTFNSLQINGLIHQGDKIGIMTPIFSPYLEIPKMERFQLKMVCIKANEANDWDVPEEEVAKLRDKKIKALFMVNPTNPTAQSLSKESIKRIGNTVRKYNPNLIILTDDVYAPFVDEYNSLYNELPFNTIAVYSFSKYFGVTGWRLGVVMINKNNVLDKILIPNLDKKRKDILQARYEIATMDVDKVSFLDRIVLDSREVAEAHTGGLSTPQQTIMSLFALQELMDPEEKYSREIKKILTKRMSNLCTPIKYPNIHNKRSSYYYIILNLLVIGEILYDKEFAQWMHKHVDPLEILFILAEKFSIVLLPGEGFAAPPWSVRVSLANLETPDYSTIGNSIKAAFAILRGKYHAGFMGKN